MHENCERQLDVQLVATYKRIAGLILLKDSAIPVWITSLIRLRNCTPPERREPGDEAILRPAQRRSTAEHDAEAIPWTQITAKSTRRPWAFRVNQIQCGG